MIKVDLIKIPCQLTAKTIHIHIFYFPTISLVFRDKMIKNRLVWLAIDSCWLWLEADLGSRLARVTLQLIISRFLPYKDCEQIHLLGHPLKSTVGLQNVPRHALRYCWKKKKANGHRQNCEKEQNTASFSKSRPDKLFNSGKLWPIGKHLVFFLINNMRLYSTRLVNGSCSKST